MLPAVQNTIYLHLKKKQHAFAFKLLIQIEGAKN